MAAWFSGVLSLVMAELDETKWAIGGHQFALGDLLGGAFTAAGLIAVALWLSAAVDTRLLMNAVGAELSVLKAISNIVRVLFVFLGLMMAQKQSFSIEKNHFQGLKTIALFKV